MEIENFFGSRCWQLAMKRHKKDVWKLTNKKQERLKCIYQSKKKINAQFGRTMNEDVN